ncbi:MAG: hypothetical protein K0Q63_924 [Paenibacillus sp.]|nr:hypothetical protein [Paenibacillus sp.]
MSYSEEHERWIKRHAALRKGERLDALKRGHGYGNQLFAERIWWPLVGHFLGLHPEYEVKDWRGRSYFVDFMWLVGSMRIVFEIMDYGSHGTDRTKYRQDMNRGLYLQSQDCLVYCISLDELKENPSFVLSVLRSIIAPYLAAVNGGTGIVERQYGKIERELMRAAIRNNRIVRPKETARVLELHSHTVIKYCRVLVQRGKFRAVTTGKSERVVYYEYIGTLQSADLV